MLIINYPTARNGASLQTLGAKRTSISSDSSVLKIESDIIYNETELHKEGNYSQCRNIIDIISFIILKTYYSGNRM